MRGAYLLLVLLVEPRLVSQLRIRPIIVDVPRVLALVVAQVDNVAQYVPDVSTDCEQHHTRRHLIAIAQWAGVTQ